MPVIVRCHAAGCQQDQPCPTHSRTAQAKRYDDRRGTSASRGYDRQWRKFTDSYRIELHRRRVPDAGMCGSRLPNAPPTQDSDCLKLGRVTIGRVVDHITPATGPDDPRFYDVNNLQLLCDGVKGFGCHDRKRQRERRGGESA
jgi:hypothetical protein